MKRGFEFKQNDSFYKHLKEIGLSDVAYAIVKINDISGYWVTPSPSKKGYATWDKEFGCLTDGNSIKDIIYGTVECGEMYIKDGHYTEEESKAVTRYISQLKKSKNPHMKGVLLPRQYEYKGNIRDNSLFRVEAIKHYGQAKGDMMGFALEKTGYIVVPSNNPQKGKYLLVDTISDFVYEDKDYCKTMDDVLKETIKIVKWYRKEGYIDEGRTQEILNGLK